MATIDASNLTAFYNIFASGSADFSSYVSHSSTSYIFLTNDGHAVTMTGTGITVDGSNLPTGGTITSITIDVGNNSVGTPDVEISGINLNITDFIFAAGDAANAEYWDLVLDGETEIISGSDGAFNISGDEFDVNNGFREGAADTFSGAGSDGSVIYADADDVSGNAIFIGGDDVIGGVADLVFGDVDGVFDSARFIGGDDMIVFTDDYISQMSDTIVTVAGDANIVNDDVGVVGGSDVIDGRSIVSAGLIAYGDVNDIFATAIVSGGDDLIYGAAMTNRLYGDADVVSSLGSLVGGDDTIYGGDADDFIYGDYRTNNSSGGVRGGDDSLFGLGGDDTIFGNEGLDTISGGSGHDILDGGAHADTITGGTGNDVISGGSGTDYLDGGKGEDIITGGDGNDFILGGNVGDTLSGGNDNDTIQGQSGNDTINGNAGNDILIGQIGDDTISGGAGDDILNAGAGDDSLTGGSGTDIFTFTNSTGANQITDFEDGTDLIHFTSNNLQFGDLTIQQSGADVLITAGVQTILVLNSDVADFDASDFMFGS